MNGHGALRATGIGPGWTAAAYGLVLIIVLAPLTLALVPPLIDFPNHLAKIHIAASLPENTHLAQFYEWRLRLVPNLAQDLIVPPLARLVGAYAALKLFLGWSLVQLVLGVCLLRYALLGRVGLWPLAAVLFLFNKVLWWGFVNFLFTSGLVLLLFAVWILMANRGPMPRVILFTLLMPAMFFCHLIATAILTACIGTYQLQRIWTALKPDFKNAAARRFGLREVLVTAIPLLPLPILWRLSPTGANEQPFIHKGLENFADALFSPFVMSGTTWDYAFGIAVLAFLALAFASRQIALTRPLWLTVFTLGAIAAVMPLMVLGVFGTHFRIPYLLGCLIAAGLEVRRPKPLFALTAAMVIGTVFVFRGVHLVQEWRRFDVRTDQYRAALALVPPGAKMLPVLDHTDTAAWPGAVNQQVFWHLSALAVIEASAFDPLLFSSPIRQSVAVRDSMRHLDVTIGQPLATHQASTAYRNAVAAATGGTPVSPGRWYGRDWSRWFKEYDYVIRFSFKSPRDVLAGPLTPMAKGDWFDLYRIDPTQPLGRP